MGIISMQASIGHAPQLPFPTTTSGHRRGGWPPRAASIVTSSVTAATQRWGCAHAHRDTGHPLPWGLPPGTRDAGDGGTASLPPDERCSCKMLIQGPCVDGVVQMRHDCTRVEAYTRTDKLRDDLGNRGAGTRFYFGPRTDSTALFWRSGLRPRCRNVRFLCHMVWSSSVPTFHLLAMSTVHCDLDCLGQGGASTQHYADD